VTEEIQLLGARWAGGVSSISDIVLADYLGVDEVEKLDCFDRHQLAFVIGLCRQSRSLSDAGRQLFDQSRLQKASTNDGHRLRQYLAKFNLKFDEIRS